jgi:hypothetical protein
LRGNAWQGLVEAVPSLPLARPNTVAQVIEGFIYLGALPERWRGCITSKEALVHVLCDLDQRSQPLCPWHMQRDLKPICARVLGTTLANAGTKEALRASLDRVLA